MGRDVHMTRLPGGGGEVWRFQSGSTAGGGGYSGRIVNHRPGRCFRGRGVGGPTASVHAWCTHGVITDGAPCSEAPQDGTETREGCSASSVRTVISTDLLRGYRSGCFHSFIHLFIREVKSSARDLVTQTDQRSTIELKMLGSFFVYYFGWSLELFHRNNPRLARGSQVRARGDSPGV